MARLARGILAVAQSGAVDHHIGFALFPLPFPSIGAQSPSAVAVVGVKPGPPEVQQTQQRFRNAKSQRKTQDDKSQAPDRSSHSLWGTLQLPIVVRGLD